MVFGCVDSRGDRHESRGLFYFRQMARVYQSWGSSDRIRDVTPGGSGYDRGIDRIEQKFNNAGIFCGDHFYEFGHDGCYTDRFTQLAL